MSTKLLCTYTTPERLQHTINCIVSSYTIPSNRIYLFEIDDSDEVICSYNIDSSSIILPCTISVHRKKETNTLYTINGINMLIRSLNNNVFDKNYVIDWPKYLNTIISVKEKQLKISKLLYINVIKLDNYNKDIS